MHLVRVFGEAGADAVVTPSGSCAAMVREHYPALAARSGDRGLAAEVEALAPDVLELSELLVGRLGVEEVGAYYPHRVTYHPTCHSLRLLRVGDAPLRLLRAVRGIDLVDLGDAEECCGFGGTFAVKNADVSMAMLSDKLRHVLHTEAEVCTAADSSCLMHIGGALSRQRTGVRTAHLAEILASTEADARAGAEACARAWPCRSQAGTGAAPAAAAPARRLPSPSPRAPRWATASCVATSARPPAPSGPSARGWWPSCPTGRSSARPGGS
jgi:L-lactate dehydrogenase complex protein LldE